MALDRLEVIARLRQRLRADAQRAGWGYYAGKSGRVEPTGWALLALAVDRDASQRGDWPAFLQQHLSLLSASQQADGLLRDGDAPFANFGANGFVSVVLSAPGVSSPASVNSRLLAGLADMKGVRLEQNDPKQDNQLQGWPWVQDTFSWVEPTAWSLLALKRAHAAPAGAAARVAEADKLLLNRVCVTGGWNYGNASTLGQDLRGYVPTTAIGLLAMGNRKALEPVQRSMRWLSANRLSESSTMALSLTVMALSLYGEDAADVEARLLDVVERSEQAGHLQAIAMAAYALSSSEHNLEAFRVGA